MATDKLAGSCLCGGIRYEIEGALGEMDHCHCSMCRKAHGAAFGTYALVRRSDFRVLAGDDLITRYDSSPGIYRTFCSRCGATLQWVQEKRAEWLGLAVGTLDDDPSVRPAAHIFVASKAPWYEIDDDLPQHDEDSPDG